MPNFLGQKRKEIYNTVLARKEGEGHFRMSLSTLSETLFVERTLVMFIKTTYSLPNTGDPLGIYPMGSFKQVDM